MVSESTQQPQLTQVSLSQAGIYQKDMGLRHSPWGGWGESQGAHKAPGRPAGCSVAQECPLLCLVFPVLQRHILTALPDRLSPPLQGGELFGSWVKLSVSVLSIIFTQCRKSRNIINK